MSKKLLRGEIVSVKMDKTVVVSMAADRKHPIYKKTIKSNRRFKARDDMGATVGDLVLIEEHRPFSREVTWVVKEIIKKGEK